jgi:hypothetical protein
LDKLKTITPDEIIMMTDAVIGEGRGEPVWATDSVRAGDIALILRKEGGIELLSLLPDEPTLDSVKSMGVRGLFALALYRLGQDHDAMQAAIPSAHEAAQLFAAKIQVQ